MLLAICKSLQAWPDIILHVATQIYLTSSICNANNSITDGPLMFHGLLDHSVVIFPIDMKRILFVGERRHRIGLRKKSWWIVSLHFTTKRLWHPFEVSMRFKMPSNFSKSYPNNRRPTRVDVLNMHWQKYISSTKQGTCTYVRSRQKF